tara:strand:- start:245 stop:466 length:222 start_codon:yes stop_codon:yes gene_type:complete
LLTLTKEEQARENKWAADIKYYAARSCWKRRNEATPNNPPHRRVTWAQWFEKRFGENLIEYAQRKAKEKSKTL